MRQRQVLLAVAAALFCLGGLLVVQNGHALAPVNFNWAVTAPQGVGKIISLGATSMACSQNDNCAAGTVLTPLSTVCFGMCPGTPTYSLPTAATTGCTSSDIANNANFSTILGNFSVASSGPNIVGGHLSVGVYRAGIVVSIPNSPNTGVCIPVTVESISGPTITVNGWGGSSLGAIYIVAGTTMTINVGGGAGLQNDQIYVCSTSSCFQADEDYDYLSCSKFQPSAPYPTHAVCNLAAPTTFASGWRIVFQSDGQSPAIFFQTVTQVPAVAGTTFSGSTFTCGVYNNAGIGTLTLNGSGNIGGSFAQMDVAGEQAGVWMGYTGDGEHPSVPLPTNVFVGPGACYNGPHGNYLIGMEGNYTLPAAYGWPGIINGDWYRAFGRSPQLTGCGNVDCPGIASQYGLYPWFNQDPTQVANAVANNSAAHTLWLSDARTYTMAPTTYYTRACSEWQGDAACSPWNNNNENDGEKFTPSDWVTGMRNFITFMRTFPGYQHVKIGFDMPAAGNTEENKYYVGSDIIDFVSYDIYAGKGQGATSQDAWNTLLTLELNPMVATGLPMAIPEFCDKFGDGYITQQLGQWAATHNVISIMFVNTIYGAYGPNQEVNCSIDATPQKLLAFQQNWLGWRYTGTFFPKLIPWQNITNTLGP